ncbi:acetylxylan esterase, partial [Kitasatospora herbaricolor]|uniref:acetylxylan esterase n=1 Tax=Kitasatospora herbaricolor TaxID=68217 RepID=UPI0036DD95C9
EARTYPLDVRCEPATTALTTVDVFDVRFNGAGGQSVAAWLRIPAGATGPLPVVVEYDGYGRGRGEPEQNLLWASAGFAHLEMDTRGQSWSGWRSVTPDPIGGDSHMPGMLTKGIADPHDYYYRRVFTDAVRALECLRDLPAVDTGRVFVLGTSQGGGIALAATAPRAIKITDTHPYKELTDYLAIYRDREESTLHTLSYFDGVQFARRAKVPALFSVGLVDAVCPPSTVYAAFNAFAGNKDINVWRYNGHEGGGIEDDLRAIAAIREWSNRE